MALHVRKKEGVILRIVTFNVFWLQGSSYPDYRPGPPQQDVLEAVAVLVRQLVPDLLCVQELQSAEAAGSLAATLGMTNWFYSPGQLPDRRQYGGGVFAAGTDWRLSAVDDSRLDRFAVKAVRPRDGLCVANVHLRSDRFEPADRAGAARREELAAVLETSPQPAVICGDFNSRWASDLWDGLRERGYFDAAERAGQAAAFTSIGHGQGDRIWIHRDLAPGFVSAEVIAKDRFLVRKGEYVSDHLPVVAELDA